MKIIIIEGTDNVGKDTIINRLQQEFINCAVIHCERPPVATPKEMALYQQNEFIHLMGNTLYQYIAYTTLNVGDTFGLIHNRSWYGEYVYGCMYRENDDKFVKHMIRSLETALINSIKPEDLYFITLLSDNMEFLSRNEDGLSISRGEIDNMYKETERFKDIYNYSLIKNKHVVYVNNGINFRPHDEIYNEILSFINKNG